MPLPLPNLDSRRWSDLVEEGRALIPRYAPAWTDHNIHDPGITLMELLAWLVEQDIYRANRVPARHRRKFLELAGFAPRLPQPARVPITFTLSPGEPALTLPAGTTVATGTTYPDKRAFRTASGATIVPVELITLQSFVGGRFVDHTRLWRDGLPFHLLGDDPADGDAIYFGFDLPLPAAIPISLWFWWGGDDQQSASFAEQGRNSAESGTTPGGGAPALQHHSVKLAWEYFDGSDWRSLEAVDGTRGLTLDGQMHLTLPGTMVATSLGVVATPRFYLRLLLAQGRPDYPPMLRTVALNTVEAIQSIPARSTLAIAPGVLPDSGKEPVKGSWQHLQLTLDASGNIGALAAFTPGDTAGDGLPKALVLDYQPATVVEAGSLSVTLQLAGKGDGHPDQQLVLRDLQVSGGQLALWSLKQDQLLAWELRPDLDASLRTEAHFSLDPTAGLVTFGDGERGLPPQQGSHLLAQYHYTAGANGNVNAHRSWYLAGADDVLNGALLGGDVADTAAKLARIQNLSPASGGSNQESLAQASGRAAEFLWAHERLAELCAEGQCATLDQLDRSVVRQRMAPPRATTLWDYERLALDVPGTKVERARAWAGIDPSYPCLKAPGTVTVVIMPALPLGRPQPTDGLLETVYRHLYQRRTIGTRLVVTGPKYVDVTVNGTVRVKDGVDMARVQTDITRALEAFLDPLRGGPGGRGWPFGRDVYRSEILQVIDDVTGVDHVLSLQLSAGDGEPQCGNLCVWLTSVVASGMHTITVVT